MKWHAATLTRQQSRLAFIRARHQRRPIVTTEIEIVVKDFLARGTALHEQGLIDLSDCDFEI